MKLKGKHYIIIWSIFVLVIVFIGMFSKKENNSIFNSIYTNTYYVSPQGSDSNSGSFSYPFKTYKKALAVATKDSLIYVRDGTYISEGANFLNNSVTVTNYPNEQVVIQLKTGSSQAFYCWTKAGFGYKSDIRIVATDIESERTLSNGIKSKKGIVILGSVGTSNIGILAEPGCDNWEVSGIDFIDVGHAIFTLKKTNSQSISAYGNLSDLSADKWNVHDNRIYRYYRETGFQFNGNNNRLENNEVIKGTSQVVSSYGCYLVNLLGHGNIVKNNILIGDGTGKCSGILFEWSQSDNNLISNNKITKVKNGIEFQGGDNNTIENNYIEATGKIYSINNYSNSQTSWPCDDRSGGSGAALVPPNDSSHPDYPYYYPYGECQSLGNIFITSSNTVTPSRTITVTNSPTPSLTNSKTSTLIPTFTNTITLTNTPSKINTSTITVTMTSSLTPTNTLTITPTYTQTLLPTETLTPLYIDNVSTAFYYTGIWNEILAQGSYKGSYAESSSENSKVEFNFYGESFSVLYRSGLEYGRVNVYVDGVKTDTFLEYSENTKYRKQWDYKRKLPRGNHNIQLVFVGPVDSKMSFDGIIIK